jgi:hypothetical protein
MAERLCSHRPTQKIASRHHRHYKRTTTAKGGGENNDDIDRTFVLQVSVFLRASSTCFVPPPHPACHESISQRKRTAKPQRRERRTLTRLHIHILCLLIQMEHVTPRMTRELSNGSEHRANAHKNGFGDIFPRTYTHAQAVRTHETYNV